MSTEVIPLCSSGGLSMYHCTVLLPGFWSSCSWPGSDFSAWQRYVPYTHNLYFQAICFGEDITASLCQSLLCRYLQVCSHSRANAFELAVSLPHPKWPGKSLFPWNAFIPEKYWTGQNSSSVTVCLSFWKIPPLFLCFSLIATSPSSSERVSLHISKSACRTSGGWLRQYTFGNKKNSCKRTLSLYI